MTAAPAPLSSLAYQEALLRIARLPTDRAVTLDEALGWVTTIAGEALLVERVGVWLLTPDFTELRCLDLRQRSTGAHVKGIRLTSADYPDYFTELAHARALVAHDACEHPATRCFRDSYLNPLGITSMLDAPIFRAGALSGVVCHEHVGPLRRWNDDEVRFAASVADLAGQVVEHWEHRQAADALARQEQRMRQAETLEALGRMAGGVAHDFNNLLTTILGYGQIIAQRGRDRPEIADPAGKLVQVAERAADLTRQLMSFSRQQELILEPVMIDTVVQGMDQLLRPLIIGPYRLDLALGGPGKVHADTTHLVRAIINLVINARDAMPDGGPITIRTGERLVNVGEVVAVEGGSLTAGRWAVIAVSDQGCGMDSTVRSHLFEPFFTTKPRERGTGLGLSSVWSVVQSCHGRIQVESTLGKGTTMTILLPRIDQ